MKNNKGNIVIGLILVSIGVLWLLTNLNLFDFNFRYLFTSISRLWPLILVIVGLSFVIKNRLFNSLLWLFFLILIFAYGYYLQERAPIPYPYEIGEAKAHSIPLERGVSNGKIDLDLGAMKFDIQSDNDKEDFATITSTLSDINVDSSTENQIQRLYISRKYFMGMGRNFSGITNHENENLNVVVSEEIPWSFDIDAGAVDGSLRLDAIEIEKMDIDLGAGNLEIYLSDKTREASIDIDSGASSIELNIPENVGMLIEFNGGLSSIDLAEFNFIKQSEDTYITSNYQDAKSKYNVNVDMGLGDFKVNKY